MKKILIAFPQEEISEAALSYAIQLNAKAPALLTAVFLPHVVMSNFWTSPPVLADPVLVPMMEEVDLVVSGKIKQQFMDRCVAEGLSYRVQEASREGGFPDIVRESRFADVMLVCGADYFDSPYFDMAWDNLHRTLHDIECPVLVVPPSGSFPLKNIIAYDGSASSVYALKQFAYLFPELATNETQLVYAHAEPGKLIPDADRIDDLARQHFSNLTLTELPIHPRHLFPAWLEEQKGALLVCGSMGRGMLSQAFRKSFAYEIIIDQKLPVFIAHK
jgi:nucleotide-binding universal stress UspA family protein